ncbi:hypothetical protein ACJ41P_10665 [Azospirillum argentinense]|uniref:DUF4376 domain-containing protein n=1 Tax=Azospirillum argentinense TaxID=2970906 RepID=A0ABW8V8L3_9PROT
MSALIEQAAKDAYATSVKLTWQSTRTDPPTWETTSEDVREVWRKIACAALGTDQSLEPPFSAHPKWALELDIALSDMSGDVLSQILEVEEEGKVISDVEKAELNAKHETIDMVREWLGLAAIGELKV